MNIKKQITNIDKTDTSMSDSLNLILPIPSLSMFLSLMLSSHIRNNFTSRETDVISSERSDKWGKQATLLYWVEEKSAIFLELKQTLLRDKIISNMSFQI